MSNDDLYQHPYPAPELAAAHPFIELVHERRPVDEMQATATAFRKQMEQRRSVRMIAPDPVPLGLIDAAIATASTAPSGAVTSGPTDLIIPSSTRT